MIAISQWCTDKVTANTFQASAGTQWYEPTIAGASTFGSQLFDTQTYEGVLGLLRTLHADDYSQYLQGFMEKGLRSFGSSWRYADICTVLFVLASNLKVESYLEIGVRRGRSLGMVLAQRPEADAVCFDMWVQSYAGMENPGPDFVRQEMLRLGHTGTLEFINGNSHDTVPQYLTAHPTRTFDLITVDGDHSMEGALRDMVNVLPRLRVGGALVFDDIAHPQHSYLYDLWEKCIAAQPNMTSFEFIELGYGVAFAVRRS